MAAAKKAATKKVTKKRVKKNVEHGQEITYQQRRKVIIIVAEKMEPKQECRTDNKPGKSTKRAPKAPVIIVTVETDDCIQVSDRSEFRQVIAEAGEKALAEKVRNK